MSLALDAPGYYVVTGTTEEVLTESALDPASLPLATMGVSLTALARSAGGSAATFRVRIGGTSGAADGAVTATLTTTASGWQELAAAGSAAKPGAPTLVKITGQSSIAGQAASIRGAEVRLT